MPSLIKTMTIIQIWLLLFQPMIIIDSKNNNVEQLLNIGNLYYCDLKVDKLADIKVTALPTNNNNVDMCDEDIDLIALVTMAEAEDEPEYGKRLVIDTILNRIDSKYYPKTASDVIYQRSQFTSMWNGRVDRCEVRSDIRQLVVEEINNRVNSEVIYFTEGYYADYGTPMFIVGGHYFASY